MRGAKMESKGKSIFGQRHAACERSVTFREGRDESGALRGSRKHDNGCKLLCKYMIRFKKN